MKPINLKHNRLFSDDRSKLASTCRYLLIILIIFDLESPCNAQSREAYFNGSSHVLLSGAVSLGKWTSFSFRTCGPGTLLSENGSTGDTFSIDLLSNGSLQIAWVVQRMADGVIVSGNLFDNRWHNVDLKYDAGTGLTLRVDRRSVVVANETLRSYLLRSADFSKSYPNLFVGRNFTGCILEGPGVVLSRTLVDSVAVTWGGCPLPNTKSCVGYGENHCFSQPCQKNSLCISLADTYTCRCSTRYTGTNCEVDNGPLCEIAEYNRCENGGTCQEDKFGNRTTCLCPPRYTGSNCETVVDSSVCDNHPCHNGGTCNVNKMRNGYECACPEGFAGNQCDLNVDECLSSPCQNNATCTDEQNSFSCDCRGTGYRGKTCEININECEESGPCLHGSTCFDRYGDYVCLCASNTAGKNCEQELSACSSKPCLNGGSCVEVQGRYECRCTLGFEGHNCEVNIDDCFGVLCPPHAECVDDINRHICSCKTGYEGSPPNCTKMESCKINPCMNGGVCTANEEGFYCHCPDGYTGGQCQRFNSTRFSNHATIACKSGFDCRNEENNCDSSPCKNNATCTNLEPGYNCKCMSVWSGKNCDVRILGSSVNACGSFPCVHGQCVEYASNVRCVCEPGFTGQHCETSINDCYPNPCQNGGSCLGETGNYTCHCLPQFTGRNCTETVDACKSQPCQQGGTCSSVPLSTSFVCICPSGYSGDRCQTNIDDCRGVVCPLGQDCFDLVNGHECRCHVGFKGHSCQENINECEQNPCGNGTCLDGIGNFTCLCPAGFTGHQCEEDIDECRSSPCIYGLCQNNRGGYDCFCTPGYTGGSCHIDIDECLSYPCLNNGTCMNVINDYNCVCAPGFTGRNCETNINECLPDPCQNSGLCLDGIATYTCSCLPGFTGIDCEVNIDECESTPCLNNGTCIDDINRYYCDCTNTGFTGDACEHNIDDCAFAPCENEGTCADKIKDFACHCHPGYEGKRCEVDVPECASSPCQNSAPCLEKSNQTLYHINYRDLFRKFSYSSASGYVCLCHDGFRGPNCEVNIDDCEFHRCINGTCIDGINNYTCKCIPGYRGEYCTEEINECLEYSPCKNGGTCIDGLATYTCLCPTDYGDQNCSTELQGCKPDNCQNDARCEPYLENGHHEFRCHCPLGFTGPLCSVSTTASFSGQSILTHRNTSNNRNDYDIYLQFRTTLPNGILALGSHEYLSYVLYLEDGNVNLAVDDSSMLHWLKQNEHNAYYSRSVALNDGDWKDIHVHIGVDKVVLNISNWLKEEVIRLRNAKIQVTLIGGGGLSDNLFHTLGPLPNFTGCIREININKVLLAPEDENRTDVALGCYREVQCSDDTCLNGGVCVDLWFSFQCQCHRPYFGNICENSVTPGTFGLGSQASWISMPIPEEDHRTLGEKVNVSFFLRTRERAGFLFYLGPLTSDPAHYSGESSLSSAFLSALLDSGHLKVMFGGGGGSVTVTNSDVQLDDGYYHFIRVFRNSSHLTVGINETLHSEAVGNAFLDAQILYVGGLPSASPRNKRQTEGTRIHTTHSLENITPFRGIIQDFRLDGKLVMFFPHQISDREDTEHDEPPTYTVNVTINHVTAGVVSNNPCNASNPCQNDGVCADEWNKYRCECSKGFRGINCTEREPCSLFDCPSNSHCNNLAFGYECVAAASFRGHMPLQYNPTFAPSFTMNTITLRYRSTHPGGTVLYLSRRLGGVHYHLSIQINDAIIVQWKLKNDENVGTINFGNNATDGEWHTVSVEIKDTTLDGTFDGNDSRSAEYNSTVTLSQVVEKGQITVAPDKDSFKGCLEEIRIGGILLPFFSRGELANDTSPERFELEDGTRPHIGCKLCWHEDCQNGGRCKNQDASFDCSCLGNFVGKFCESDRDECLENVCLAGSTCHNTFGGFECSCVAGYTGKHCNETIDYCKDGPCKNGGSCLSKLGSYSCICTDDFSGPNCEEPKYTTCSPYTCKNGGTCEEKTTNFQNKFTCRCPMGYYGKRCELEVNHCASTPCLNKATCHNIPSKGFHCLCPSEFTGSVCETEINACLSNPCQHGTCNGDLTTFNCMCNRGFQGYFCSEDVKECSDNPCVNSTCVELNGDYRCDCPNGWIGKNCTVADPCVEEHNCTKDGKRCNSVFLNDTHATYNCTDAWEVEAVGGNDIVVIIGSVVGFVCFVCIVVTAVIFLRVARKKRATRGTYSPSRQEMFGSRVEMNQVMKPPPEERLI